MATKTPQILKGFRDYLPNEQIARRKMMAKISEVFERFGFAPIDTPSLEPYELLGGKYGEEGEKLMYKFKDAGDRMVALRYDLTVPLARVAASYPQLPTPFKRYQIANVWRAEKPQKGRFRELVQCDVDIVGSDSLIADAEVIAAINEAFKALEIGEVVVKINNRKFIDQALKKLKVPAQKIALFTRTIDKTDKLGEKKVFELLKQEGFAKPILENYPKFMDELAAGWLTEFQSLLESYGVSNIKFDKFLARGLDYYTSNIFEFGLVNKPEFGSVAGGGRYDNLIEKISGKDMPAVGCSIGLDRLFAALNESKLIAPQTAAEVVVLNLSDKLIADYLNMATNLRKSGIDCEFYFKPDKLPKQFKYAQSKNMKLAVIFGSDEAKNREVSIKDLTQKRQVTVPLENLVTEVKSMLW